MNIMTISEISKVTNKSQKTIRRHIAAGDLPARKIQNKYQIIESDLKKWLNTPNRKNLVNENSTVIPRLDIVNYISIDNMWKINGWINYKDRTKLNFIDLFSGAGGLSCGLVMSGFNPVASVEIMPEAVETYKYNFIEKKGFDHHIENNDIKKELSKINLYNSVKDKKIHLIAGGFPCQGFSMSGYRVETDPRNNLYLEMLSIVKHIKPDYVVMENVEGLRSMLNGKIEEKIIDDYKKIGYDINVAILNSADYFVPQIRKRLIFIGNRIGAINYHPKPLISENNYITLGQAIKKYMNIDENYEINHIFTKHSLSMIERIKNVPVGGTLYNNYSDSWKRSPWNKPSCTVKENHGGVNIHPKLNRVLTPRELAALQSFPDDFIFKGSKKWQLVQIGNAVSPLMGKAIGLAIQKSIFEKN